MRVGHRHYDFFLSYSRSDAERVRPLVEELRRLRYEVFFDLESIGVGERWKARLETSIRASRALVLCWSAQARVSEYVQFEYAQAEVLGKQVMPWLLDDTPLPAMVEIQAVTNTDASAVAAVLAARIGWNLSRRRCLAITATGLIGAAAVAIWMRPRHYDFQGVVTDTDNLPLPGVAVDGETVSARTDSGGMFKLRIPGVRPQWIRLRFSKAGYQTEARNAATGEIFRIALVKHRTD